MPRLILSIILSSLVVSAGEARPATRAMSCGDAQLFVSAQGAVVMDTGPQTYERFVGSAASCLPGERTYWAYAPTSDVRRCQIGYVCKPIVHDNR